MSLLNIKDGLQLDYQSYGRDTDPAVLLIAGAGSPAAFWPESFCRRLSAAGFRVIRFSHRDTGLSTHFDQQYELIELRDDVLAVLGRLECGPAHLVGHSMGGYLAQMAACARPDLAASVTSMSAGSTVNPEKKTELGMSSVTDATWEVLMQNRPTGDLARDLDGWMMVWRFLNGSRTFDSDRATAYTRALYQGDPRNARVARNHVHAMTTVPESLVDDLARLSCPVTVIHGTDDALVPFDNGEATARLVPGARLLALAGAGHMFFHETIWTEIGNGILEGIS